MNRYHFNKTEFVYLNLKGKRDQTSLSFIVNYVHVCVCVMKVFPKGIGPLTLDEHALWLRSFFFQM